MNLLTDPIKQPGFGRANPRRAFYIAEKITHTISCKHYNPATDTAPIRPGSQDALACPSRIGDVLFYRSGEVELDPIPHTQSQRMRCID